MTSDLLTRAPRRASDTTPSDIPPHASPSPLLDKTDVLIRTAGTRPLGRCQWLIQESGSFWERGRVLEFPAAINEGTLGRSFSSNWRFNDPSVSRLHAALVRKPRRGVYLVDLGGRDGTFVNDEPVEGEILLMDGDRIRLGPTVEVRFLDTPPPVESPERIWMRRAWWAIGGVGVVVLSALFYFI